MVSLYGCSIEVVLSTQLIRLMCIICVCVCVFVCVCVCVCVWGSWSYSGAVEQGEWEPHCFGSWLWYTHMGQESEWGWEGVTWHNDRHLLNMSHTLGTPTLHPPPHTSHYTLHTTLRCKALTASYHTLVHSGGGGDYTWNILKPQKFWAHIWAVITFFPFLLCK